MDRNEANNDDDYNNAAQHGNTYSNYLIPDPSVATTAFVLRISHQHERLVEEQLKVLESNLKAVNHQLTERVEGMDKANSVLADNVNRTPTLLQTGLKNAQELVDVKFSSIHSQFEVLDRQTAREKAAADLALAAAFDAQKEAAAATNNANAEAIRKSELATAETIKTNAEVVRSGNTALTDKIEDVKERQNRLETSIASILAGNAGSRDYKEDHLKETASAMQRTVVIIAAVSVLMTIIGIATSIFIATGR